MRTRIGGLICGRIICGWLGFACLSVSTVHAQAPSPLEYAKRLADSEISRRGSSLAYPSRWTYQMGFFLHSLLELGVATGEPQYQEYVRTTFDSFIDPKGKIRGYEAKEYALDSVQPGRVALALYDVTGDPRYRKVADTLRAQLKSQPRTKSGGFFHKKVYAYQMWLDGLFMHAPFYARYAHSWGSARDFDDIRKQFLLVEAHLKNSPTGLLFHGWDEKCKQKWAPKPACISRSFWGRGNGWYAMALIDTLDSMADDSALTGAFRDLVSGVVAAQDPTSRLWFQVLDQRLRAGNYAESSASGMFVYAIAKGVRTGVLPQPYLDAAEQAFEAMTSSFIQLHSDGMLSLTQTCSVAGLGPDRNGTFEYYISEPIVSNDLKGVAAFILAGVELERAQ